MGCAAAFLRLPEQVDKSSLACKICDWQAAHSVSAGLPCPSAPHKPNHVLGFLYCPPPCHGLHPSLHTHCAQPCPSLDKPFGISVHPRPQLLPSLCISEQAFRTQMRTSISPFSLSGHGFLPQGRGPAPSSFLLKGHSFLSISSCVSLLLIGAYPIRVCPQMHLVESPTVSEMMAMSTPTHLFTRPRQRRALFQAE